MIKNSAPNKKEKEEFKQKIAHQFIKFLTIVWLWTVLAHSILVFIIYIIGVSQNEFDTKEFVRLLIKYLIFFFLTLSVLTVSRKLGRIKSYYIYHDIIILCALIICLPILIYYNMYNQNEIFQKGQYYYVFSTQMYFLAYFVPWMTIFNKKIKFFSYLYAQSLLVFYTILFNENDLDKFEIAKTILFLIMKGFIGYIAASFVHILFKDIYKVNREKKEEDLKWKKIINQLPTGFIIIAKKDKQILFMNESAKKIFDCQTDNYMHFLSYFNQKLGFMSCWSHLENGIFSHTQNGFSLIPDENINLKKFQLAEFLELICESPRQNVKRGDDHIFYLETGEEGVQRLSIKIDIFVNFNGVECFAVFVEDISWREITKTLKRNYEYQSSLLKSFSHELKTPLNSSIPSLEMGIMSLPTESKIVQESLVPALKSMKILHFILSSIIDLNSMISDQFVLDIERISVSDFIYSLFSLMDPQIQQKGLKLIFKKDPDVDEIFHNDMQRVSTILLNLLSNAVKFTFEGNIQVTVSKYSQQKLKFSILDTGIGIQSNVVTKMNDYFQQKQCPDLNFFYFSDSGICLGLNVSNKLAHLISDEDKANQIGLFIDLSIENKGTTITFIAHNHRNLFQRENHKKVSVLIIDTSYNQFNILDSIDSPELKIFEEIREKVDEKISQEFKNPFEKINKMKFNFSKILNEVIICVCPSILIVDDDSFNQLSLELILRKFNLKCQKANHGREAIEIMKAFKKCSHCCNGYRLVFMDYQMPIMDGVETTIKLREMFENEEIQPILIIGCTAYGTKMEVESFYKSGIQDLIIKPITLNRIKEILCKWNIVGNSV